MLEECKALKVTSSHLKRDAYLYVRQSTLRQVLENTESTMRQYALKSRAVALGWPMERVHVIDCDLGQSGASAADREGFKQLVTEVGLGNAGIILGLEVSRLARNCADWHRLLEICALSDTLILDEDGLYDINDFNDRLLLGLKGTMSEAELHFLQARMRGGMISKAKRGELTWQLPAGFVYDDQGRVHLDPDVQVRQSITLFFQTFRRVGSALATVKYFRKQEILFPLLPLIGPRKNKVVWRELSHAEALHILHNPRYAGVFFFGRTRSRRDGNGRTVSRTLPRDEWHAFIPGAHAGYISLEEYEDNQRRLREYAQAYGQERRKSPPREGPALLQGLVICGLCGYRMTVSYHTRGGCQCPEYICRGKAKPGQPSCQHMTGGDIDRAVGELLVSMLTPLALDVALAVQQEVSLRLEEANSLRAKQVERVRYEAEAARRRYMLVDPANRLVADALEADWNEKLRALTDAQEEYERRRQADRMFVSEEERANIMALSTEFPKLWNDPHTPHRERKRMIRLLVEDVTLKRSEEITAHIRFKGGAETTITLPCPKNAKELWQTPPEVVAEIDRLLDHHTEAQIIAILNKNGVRTGTSAMFSSPSIKHIIKNYGLKNRYQRLRETGMLTAREMAERLGVSISTIWSWNKQGLLPVYIYNDRNACLYPPPGPNAPVKGQHKNLSEKTSACSNYPPSYHGGAV